MDIRTERRLSNNKTLMSDANPVKMRTSRHLFLFVYLLSLLLLRGSSARVVTPLISDETARALTRTTFSVRRCIRRLDRCNMRESKRRQIRLHARANSRNPIPSSAGPPASRLDDEIRWRHTHPISANQAASIALTALFDSFRFSFRSYLYHQSG